MSDTEQAMQALGSALDEGLNEKGEAKEYGFVLLVFPFDGQEVQWTNYVSNANRQDMIVALKEIVSRFEGQAYQTGRA